ncbi:MAG: elongation factor P [Spirochaetes bacterium]|nr:elongation factor P [Spirochaetota bacterium]
MINANDIKNGMILKVGGELCIVSGFQHTKPGKGPAYLKVKLKNLLKGKVTEKTFRTGEKLEDAYVERKTAQFMYKADNEYIFMDQEDYEHIHLNSSYLDGDENLLKEGETIEIQFYENNPISVLLPTFVKLKVISTEPGMKGDTVSSTLKPAKLETGLEVQVPLFINEGDIIKVDTRDKSYSERA